MSELFNAKLQEEVDENFKYFEALPYAMLHQYNGQYALLRKKEVIDYFDTLSDAQKYGNALFQDKLFSIQKVGEIPLRLGYIGGILYA